MVATSTPHPRRVPAASRVATASVPNGAHVPRRAVEGGSRDGSPEVEVASFDDAWDSQARAEFGDLGPAEVGRPGGDRGGARRGGGGRRGGGRR